MAGLAHRLGIGFKPEIHPSIVGWRFDRLEIDKQCPIHTEFVVQ
jgi:hypothetical protein